MNWLLERCRSVHRAWAEIPDPRPDLPWTVFRTFQDQEDRFELIQARDWTAAEARAEVRRRKEADGSESVEPTESEPPASVVESDQELRSTAQPRRERQPPGPERSLERTVSNALNGADKFLELLGSVPPSTHITYVEEVNRVIDSWTEVQDRLWSSARAGAGSLPRKAA